MSESWIAYTKAGRKKMVSVLEATTFVMVLALLAMVILQVTARYVMQVSIPWTEEVARMILVWVVMIGATIAADRNEHYAITFLSGKLRGFPRLAMLIATNILGLVFLAVLVVYGTRYVMANMNTVYVSTQMSRAWVYAAMPGCAVLMAISLVFQSIEAWLAGADAAPKVATVTGDI